MLWEAIVDRGPWDDQPDAAVWRSLRSGVVPRVREVWPYIDPSLGAIVDRSMSVNPDGRYPTAVEMRTDLERYIATRQLRLPSAESLGDFVSRLFAEERETRWAQLSAQLQAVTAADPAAPAAPAGGASVFASALASELMQPRRAASSVAPPYLPTTPRRASWDSRPRTMLPVAASACLGAFIALAAVSATRLHAGNERIAGARPAALVATAIRPPIPVVSIDEVPRAPATAAAALPPTLRVNTKPAAQTARSIPSPPKSDCEPPYSVNPETGKKHWRLECL
jgi:hypothetical protein